MAASLALNLILGGWWLITAIEGKTDAPNGRIGVLVKEVQVGAFNSDTVMFTLPKGLVVRDASVSGAGWFEPHRFRIVITSDDTSLVDYSSKASLAQQTEHYSADVLKRKVAKQ